jgi:hypothetical protein
MTYLILGLVVTMIIAVILLMVDFFTGLFKIHWK